ncbi:hypothetical protein [Planosporangium mesophilum]|uniref:Uncharacterized protein n=1 Tax=Planosporangium mesophilum TaxID=689768 RepID=A0A8J3TEC3_9ACTN|nr:hypothetical protein [Planosporangium mesophilum]NJC81967.1 hypothetical protein [Planosporangium mesophilum]GII25268.1 hypothetical protein Pme01_48650 [Planosporangium mesophilum]
MSALFAVVLVTVAGLPLAFALTRSVPFAALFAPLVAALVFTVATIAMLIVGGPLVPWLVAALVAEVALAAVLLRRGGGRLLHGSWVDAVWLVVPLAVPCVFFLAQPLNWDAHSIWWLHAAYFTKGAEFSRYTIGNPLCHDLQCDYPPLPSATQAAAWSVLSGYDYRVAQALSTVVTLSAIVMLGLAVRTVTDRAPAIVSRLAAVGVMVAVWATAPATITGGQADPVWSAAFVAGAVLLLYGRDPWQRPTLPLLLLAVAALSKNEGFVQVVMFAALLTLRERRNLRRAWMVWIPVAAGGVWSALVRSLGASTDLVKGGHFRGLITGDPAVLDRIPPTLGAMWDVIGMITVLSLAVALLGALFLRGRRRELGMGSDAWMWLVAFAYAGTLVVTYAISMHDLEWHLVTSLGRVTIPLVLMACASAACWAAVAVAGDGHRAVGDDTAVDDTAGRPARAGEPEPDHEPPVRARS